MSAPTVERIPLFAADLIGTDTVVTDEGVLLPITRLTSTDDGVDVAFDGWGYVFGLGDVVDVLPRPAGIDLAELGAAVVRELAAQKALANPAVPPLRIIRVAADLEVGDWLTVGDREYKVTLLHPATREEALAAGSREVWSLGSCIPMGAGDPVKASPREFDRTVS